MVRKCVGARVSPCYQTVTERIGGLAPCRLAWRMLVDCPVCQTSSPPSSRFTGADGGVRRSGFYLVKRRLAAKHRLLHALCATCILAWEDWAGPEVQDVCVADRRWVW